MRCAADFSSFVNRFYGGIIKKMQWRMQTFLTAELWCNEELVGNKQQTMVAQSIIQYRLQLEDTNIYNPYLVEVLTMIEELRNRGVPDIENRLLERRAEMVSKYAFSIPVIAVLRSVAACSPLVEIGAGSGYWAMCLAELGADIIAFDASVPGDNPPYDWRKANAWHDDVWFFVEEGDAQSAGLFPERALFLCWPPPLSPMAMDAVEAHRKAGGQKLIFIGSEFSTADAAFHTFIKSCSLMETRRLPSWPGIEEVLYFVVYA
jgi:hypothetical protein